MRPSEYLDNAHYSSTHRWISHVSGQALFLGGFNFFIITLIMPLLLKQWDLTPTMVGLIAAAALIGCIIGSAVLGHLADHIGRKKMLILSAIIILICTLGTVIAWDSTSLILFRLLLGVGIGADYPVCASYMCETMPKNIRGKKVAQIMLINCLGSFIAVLCSYIILLCYPHINAWRVMFAVGVLPAFVILILRFQVPESPRWLFFKGRYRHAKEAIYKFTRTLHLELPPASYNKIASLTSPSLLKITLIAASTWFVMDVSGYGVGIFTPLIINSLHIANSTDYIQQILQLGKASVIVNSFILVGAIIAVLIIEKVSRIKLQAFGFIGISAGLVILAFSSIVPFGHLTFIFIGFILFNVTFNIGPDVTTYLLPAEFFPTQVRATGHGIASACGKIGAVLGVFLFPILEKEIGIVVLLFALSGVALLGFIITMTYPLDPRQRSIDEIAAILTEEPAKQGA